MKKVKQLLEQLPSPCREQALVKFDEDFFNEHKKQRAPITTIGRALAVSFDWESTDQGYKYWEEMALSN